MSNLALVPETTAEQLDLIKRTVAKGATDDELKLFLYDCQRRNVHPLDKLIHFTVRVDQKTGKRTYTPITSIDFMRSQASDSGDYAGNDDPVFVLDDEGRPVSATVTVYRMVQGQRCPFTATARWAEYYPGDRLGFMWNKMPFVMEGKCAEALALRKAFPRQLAGLYAREEMDQAEQEPKFDKEAYVEQKKAELRMPKSHSEDLPPYHQPEELPKGKDAVEFAWRERLSKCSTPEEFNQALAEVKELPQAHRTQVKTILVQRANACGLAFDKVKTEFFDVKERLEASLDDLDTQGHPETEEAPRVKPEAKDEPLPKDCERINGVLRDAKKGTKFSTAFLCFEDSGEEIEMPLSIWDKKVAQQAVDQADGLAVSAVVKHTEKEGKHYHNLISFELANGLFA